MSENVEIARKTRARRSYKSKETAQFEDFDRARFMYVRTSGGVILWNRSLSMLANGYRPSAVALHLYENFGTRLDGHSPDIDPERDRDVLDYFQRLVLPDDAVPPVPSIFDDQWGEA